MPTAIVRGDLKVYSPKPPDIAPQAQVLGRIEHIRIEEEHWAASWLKRWLYSFLALSLVGLVALGLFPWWGNRVTGRLTSQPGATLLSGLGGLLLIPLLVVLLLATVIGIPLAFIVLALFVIALMLSGVFVSWWVGGWLCEQFQQPQTVRWWRMLLGTFVVALLVALPVVGALFGLLIMLVGLGALLLERRETWEQVRVERASAMS
jgi:MFS family permease